MDIGRMNKRITFLRHRERTDDMGQTAQELEEFKTVWGSLYPIRGSEFYEVQKVQARTTHKCYVRYLDGVDSNCFMRCNGTVYYIDSVIDVGMERKMLEIMCSEYLNKEAESFVE